MGFDLVIQSVVKIVHLDFYPPSQIYAVDQTENYSFEDVIQVTDQLVSKTRPVIAY